MPGTGGPSSYELTAGPTPEDEDKFVRDMKAAVEVAVQAQRDSEVRKYKLPADFRLKFELYITFITGGNHRIVQVV